MTVTLQGGQNKVCFHFISAFIIDVGIHSESVWHQNLWRSFTIKLINHISVDTRRHVVWML